MANSIFIWPGLFTYNGTNIVFIAAPDIKLTGLAVTSTDGLILENTTAATAGVPVQISPRLKWSGSAWNSVGTASETDFFIAEVLPATVAGTTTATWKLGVSIAGGAVTYPAVVGSNGTLTTLSDVLSGASLQAAAAQYVVWAGRGRIASTADGQFNFDNNAVSSGVGFNVTTDGTLAIRTRAQTGDGSISFLNALASGTITTAAGTTAIAPLVITNGTNLTAATANSIENDGGAFYNTIDTTNGRRFDDSWNYFRLTGSGTGITTIADFFGANDGIPLVANGIYEIEWHCYFSQATAGTATWTVVTATTALATLTGEYNGSNIAGIGAVGAGQTAAINTTSSSSTAFPVTGTEATGTTHYFTIRVLLTAGNGASNTRLKLTMGAGTATPLINSYFRVRRMPAANVGAFVS